MSLYLKYRPQNFKTLVGQDHAKKTIQSALRNSSLAHAYLFCGPRGTGKTSMARILAKGLNCLSPLDGPEPCNTCDICLAIGKGRLVDLIEIDAASNRGIDEIRELREKIVFAPSQAKSKVYIIDEVHMLTKEAFNALLKTLEEPPSHAYFILATTEAHKIPETIISRCQQFNFSRIATADITERLQEIVKEEGVTADEEALSLIAKLSNGGLRDAIGLLDQMIAGGSVTLESVSNNLGLTGSSHLETFFSHLVEKKALKAIELLSQITSSGQSSSQFLRELMGYLREQMLINLGSKKETASILRFIDTFTQAKSQMDLSPIPELPLEMAIIRCCDFTEAEPEAVNTLKKEEPKQESKAEKPVEEAKKEDTPVVNSDLDYKRIKADWPRVLDAIQTGFIKMSLMDGEPTAFDGGILTISFKSATYMEKVSKGSNQTEVQNAIEKIYGSKLSLNLVTKTVDLNLTKKDDTQKPNEGTVTAVEMAAEVFGINKNG